MIEEHWRNIGSMKLDVPFCLPTISDLACYERRYVDVRLAPQFGPRLHWFFIGRLDPIPRNPFCDELWFKNIIKYL